MTDESDDGEIKIENSTPDIVYKDDKREIQIDLAAREWVIVGIIALIISCASGLVIF